MPRSTSSSDRGSKLLPGSLFEPAMYCACTLMKLAARMPGDHCKDPVEQVCEREPSISGADREMPRREHENDS
jgi:hypothetical protein